MSRKNNWIVIFIYNFMLLFIYYFSFRTMIEIAVKAGSFPNSNYFIVLLSTIIGIGLLGFGVRRYIFISSKDEKERHKLRNMFLLTTLITFIIYMSASTLL